MSEPTPETPTDDAAATGDAADKPLGEAGERALAQEREARKASEKRARELQRELETFRQSSMTEAEKAVAEAEARGRTAAMAAMGQRLVRSEFLQAAARRNAGYDAAAILDDLNLARYVGDDGEPDTKAIEKAVARLVPEFAPAPGLDLGPKPLANGGPNMNDLIRKAAGRA